jgi:WD40 repeat protein
LNNLPEGGEDDECDAQGDFKEPVLSDLSLLADVPRESASGASAAADAPKRVTWAPMASGHAQGSFVTSSGTAVKSWAMREGGGVGESGVARFDSEASFIGGLAWDPHHASEVSVAMGGTVMGWDLKSGERTRAIEHAVAAGGGFVRSLSYNPNRPWYLASAGDDFRVKIWDLRRAAAPLKVLDGHSHW